MGFRLSVPAVGCRRVRLPRLPKLPQNDVNVNHGQNDSHLLLVKRDYTIILRMGQHPVPDSVSIAALRTIV